MGGFRTAAASLSVTPLSASADDGTPEGGAVGCSNIRTIANSRCVHYNEKAHDKWASQPTIHDAVEDDIDSQIKDNKANRKLPAPNGKPREQDEGRSYIRQGANDGVITFHDGPKGGLGMITTGGVWTRTNTTPGTGGSGGMRSSR